MLTCHEAVGAVIGHFVVVAAFVEHAADHMYPRTTRIALHPPLFLLIIVLPLLQFTLAHLQLQQQSNAWANSSPHSSVLRSSQGEMQDMFPGLMTCTAAMQGNRELANHLLRGAVLTVYCHTRPDRCCAWHKEDMKRKMSDGLQSASENTGSLASALGVTDPAQTCQKLYSRIQHEVNRSYDSSRGANSMIESHFPVHRAASHADHSDSSKQTV